MFQNKNISGVRENKLFADVDFSGIKLKTNPKDILTFSEGSIIYRPGDETNFIYLILNGEVKVKIPGGTNRATKVFKVGKLDFFGEKEALENLPRNSSAVAESECSVFPVKKNIILDYSNKSKNLLSNLYRKNDPNAIDIITNTPAQESVNPDFILNTESAGSVFNFGVKPKKAPEAENNSGAAPDSKAEDLSESFFKRSVLPDAEVKAPPVSYPVAKPKEGPGIPPPAAKDNNNVHTANNRVNDAPPPVNIDPGTPGFAALEKLDELVNDEAHRGIIDFDVLDENTIITDDLLRKQTVEHKFSFSDFSQEEVAKNPYDEEQEDFLQPPAEPQVKPPVSEPPVFEVAEQPEIAEEEPAPIPEIPDIPSVEDNTAGTNEVVPEEQEKSKEDDEFLIDYEAELNNSFSLKNIPIDDLDIDNLQPVKFSFESGEEEVQTDKENTVSNARKTGEDLIKDDIIEPGIDFEADLLSQREERRKSKEIILEQFGLINKGDKESDAQGKEKTDEPLISFDADGMMVLNEESLPKTEQASPKDKELSEEELSSRRKKTYDFSNEGFELNDINKFSPFDNGFIVPDPHPFEDDSTPGTIEPPSNSYDFIGGNFDIAEEKSEKKPADETGSDKFEDSFNSFGSAEESSFTGQSFTENFPFDNPADEKQNEDFQFGSGFNPPENSFDQEDMSGIFDIDDIEAKLAKDDSAFKDTDIFDIQPDAPAPQDSAEESIQQIPEIPEIPETDFPVINAEEISIPEEPETVNDSTKLFEDFIEEETGIEETGKPENEFEEFINDEISPEEETEVSEDIQTDNFSFTNNIIEEPGSEEHPFLPETSPEENSIRIDSESENFGFPYPEAEEKEIISPSESGKDIENAGSSLFFSLLGDDESGESADSNELKPFTFEDSENEVTNIFNPQELPDPLFDEEMPTDTAVPLINTGSFEEPIMEIPDTSKPEEPLFEEDSDFDITAEADAVLSTPEPLFEEEPETMQAFEEPAPAEPLFDEEINVQDEPLFEEDLIGQADRQVENNLPEEPLFEPESEQAESEPLFEENLTAQPEEQAENTVPEEPLFEPEDEPAGTEPLFEPFDASQMRSNIAKGLEEESGEETGENEITSDTPHSGWDSINFTSGLGLGAVGTNFPELNIPQGLLQDDAESIREQKAFNNEPLIEKEMPALAETREVYILPNEDNFLVNNLNSSFNYLLGSLQSIKDRLKEDEEASKLLGFFDSQAKVLQSNLDLYINYLKHEINVDIKLEDVKDFVETSLIRIAGFYDSKGKKIFKKLNIEENLYIDRDKLFAAFFEIIKFLFSLDNNIDNIYTALVKMNGSVILDIRVKEFIMSEDNLEALKSDDTGFKLAEEIINRHDASIRMSASEGKGTSIKIIFPIPIQ